MNPIIKRLVDRRHTERNDTCLEATIRVMQGFRGVPLTTQHPAKVYNLSRGGCCLGVDSLSLEGFYLLKCLDDQGEYPLQVSIATPSGPHLILNGMVKWVDRNQGQDSCIFKVGLAFEGSQSLPTNWFKLLRLAS